MSAVQYVRDARAGLRRPARWIAGALVAGLLLAGCGTAPGAAAVVDGTRISEQAVQDRAHTVVAENVSPERLASIDPVTWASLNRFQVTDAVRHQLVLAAVQDQHLTITGKQIDSFIDEHQGAAALAAQLTVPADRLRDAVFDLLAMQQLADKLPADGIDVTDITLTVDAVPAANRDAAIAARARYQADPAALDTDSQAARAAGQAPAQSESLLANPQDATFGLFTAPEGEIVLISQGTSGYFVVRVTERSTRQAKLTKDMITSASSLAAQQVLGSLLLTKYATDVTVNPRFGQWDPQMLLVVPANNGL